MGISVTGISGYLFSAQQTPMYTSTVRVIVGQTLQSVNPDYGSLAASERLVATYAQLVQSRSISQEVAKALGRADLGATTVQAQPVPDTEFLDIVVEATDPQLAADIANEYAHQLIQESPTGPQSAEARILAEVDAQITDLKNQISARDAEIKSLQEQIKNLGTDTAEAQPLIAQLQVTQQLQSDDRQTLSTLYNTVLGNRSNTVSVVEPAIMQPTPIAPHPLRAGILSGIAGLLIALGFVVGLEYIDDSIKSPDEVVDLIEAPLLAAVVKQSKVVRAPERLVTKLDPRSAGAEAFRTLRTNLQFSRIDSKTRSLLITSSQPEEGKSTVASNLAWVLAQAGQRVILIDADLRKPMLHKIFELNNEFGLTNLLTNTEDSEIAEQAIHTLTPNLRVVPSGPQPPNPSELLSSRRMEMLIWLFQQEYDWVIFDTPPVLTVTDPLALAPRTDGVLLVAAGKVTSRDALRKSYQALKTVGATLIGSVVNKLDARAEGYYSYYTYYYDQQHQEREEQPRRWWTLWSRRGDALANGHANGHTNGHTNGHANGHSNGYSNGNGNGHVQTAEAEVEPPLNDEAADAETETAAPTPDNHDQTAL